MFDKTKMKEQLRGELRGGILLLDRRHKPVGTCELCGADDQELRPFGPKDEWICFGCGMKDPDTTAAKMDELVLGKKQ